MIDRRSLLTNLAGIIAAPAVVRASSLMPIKAWRHNSGWLTPIVDLRTVLPKIVSSLDNIISPAPGDLAFLTTDSRLYLYAWNAWTLAAPAIPV